MADAVKTTNWFNDAWSQGYFGSFLLAAIVFFEVTRYFGTLLDGFLLGALTFAICRVLAVINIKLSKLLKAPSP